MCLVPEPPQQDALYFRPTEEQTQGILVRVRSPLHIRVLVVHLRDPDREAGARHGVQTVLREYR